MLNQGYTQKRKENSKNPKLILYPDFFFVL